MNNVDTDAFAEDEDQKREVAEQRAIAVSSREYIDVVEEWFKTHDEDFEERGKELVQEFEMDLPGSDPEAELEDLQDCVEVIRWYQFQIHVKLMRALMQDEMPELDGDFSKDSDGSAKVALIGMDRSIAAWMRMRRHFPQEEDAILDTIIVIDRTRRSCERDFPNARAFLRPGFDTELPSDEDIDALISG